MSYHLWASFPSKPYSRWACEIEEADTDAGFRIIRHDYKVADAMFLHRLANHLAKPIPITVMVEGADRFISGRKIVHFGEPGHFDESIRVMDHVRVGTSPGESL